ncbi:hypothetical protein AB7165_23005, partial [Escherichia coli]
MKSCFSDLPVKDGKSGTWKLDTFEITTDKALTLALRAECTGNTDEFIRHCCKVSDEAAFCLIQRPYISKTLLT